MVRFEANGNWERLGNTYNDAPSSTRKRENMNLHSKCRGCCGNCKAKELPRLHARSLGTLGKLLTQIGRIPEAKNAPREPATCTGNEYHIARHKYHSRAVKNL